MALPIGSITSPFLHMLESLHGIARTGAKHLTDDLEFQVLTSPLAHSQSFRTLTRLLPLVPSRASTGILVTGLYRSTW